MGDGNQKEAGYALVYALTSIIIASLIIALVFVMARNVHSQIKIIDTLSNIQDVQEYSLQKATQQIKKQIDDGLSKLTLIDLGNDEKIIEDLVASWVRSYELSESDIGSAHQFDYHVKLREIQATKTLPYLLNTNVGEHGWVQSNSFESDKTNVEFTFTLETNVTARGADTRKGTASAAYVYEIQWDEYDVEDVVTHMDIWRYIFYAYYLPNDAQRVSADDWIRKMYQVYDYQQVRPTFDYANYDETQPATFGYTGSVLQDFRDGYFLDFYSRPIVNDLQFEGSFIFNHGIQLDGRQMGNLFVRNMLSIRNDGSAPPTNGLHLIKDIDVQASVGMYVDLGSQRGSRLVVSQESSSFMAGNLWLNNSNSQENAQSQEGMLFGAGYLTVQPNTSGNNFQFNHYITDVTKSNPRDSAWDQFTSGSFVMTSSNFYAGPITEGTIVHTSSDTVRQIDIQGNFMLSNASISSNTGIRDFSYFTQNNGVTVPHEPSTLILEGRNTLMQVAGMTFIDAPKTVRRPSLAEAGSTEHFDAYFYDEKSWNQIVLKDGAQLVLDYTGVEPFVLEVDRTASFSMKLLPGLALFDPTFLSNGQMNHVLQGRVILEPFHAADQASLQSQLDLLGISYSLCAHASEAVEGQISIVEKSGGASIGSNQIISRTFDYVRTINY